MPPSASPEGSIILRDSEFVRVFRAREAAGGGSKPLEATEQTEHRYTHKPALRELPAAAFNALLPALSSASLITSHKKSEPLSHTTKRLTQAKKATTYSPTIRSTIGTIGLNFSVRNG